jgi:hypothetical protein
MKFETDNDFFMAYKKEGVVNADKIIDTLIKRISRTGTLNKKNYEMMKKNVDGKVD